MSARGEVSPRKEQATSIKTQPVHSTSAGGNELADSHGDPAEAAAQKAELQRNIPNTQVIKESLITELAGWIDEKKLNQSEVAEILGAALPRVSDVINKRAAKFTIDALVEMLLRAGRHVQVSIE